MKEKIVKDTVGIETQPIILFRFVCWLKTIFRSFPWVSEPIAGHNYVVTVPFTKAEVEVLKCEDCGKESIGWVKI